MCSFLQFSTTPCQAKSSVQHHAGASVRRYCYVFRTMSSRFRVQASDKTTWCLKPDDYEKLSERIARAPNERTKWRADVNWSQHAHAFAFLRGWTGDGIDLAPVYGSWAEPHFSRFRVPFWATDNSTAAKVLPIHDLTTPTFDSVMPALC
jgi:hypothetical protein